jgi:hypothetical protein
MEVFGKEEESFQRRRFFPKDFRYSQEEAIHYYTGSFRRDEDETEPARSIPSQDDGAG